MSLEDNFDKRTEELGKLIASKMKREHPDLVRELQATFKRTVQKYHKPWYQRAYARVRDYFHS